MLGAESEPLDAGRGQRYVTKAMWRVLVRRDKGCVVCGMPPRYSHAHHVVHWIDGGPTSVDNLVFLCSVHHTAVHNGHYTVTITNGKVHVTHPTWTDPPTRAAAGTTKRPAWASTRDLTGSRTPDAPPITDTRPVARTESETGAPGASVAVHGEAETGAPGPGRSSVDNDPFWGEGPPHQLLQAVRAFPMADDPPAIAELKPAGFDPWGLESHDTG